MDDAKSGLVEMGIGARYSFRPLRHLELGLSAWYHFFHDTRPEKHHDYAHEIEIPLHVGGMVQIGKTVELVILGQVGFVHAWFPDQGSGYFSGPTLRASGFEVGPEIDLLVQLTEALDLFVGARGVMQFLSATNGVSYLEQVGIVGGMVSFAGGLRVHW